MQFDKYKHIQTSDYIMKTSASEDYDIKTSASDEYDIKMANGSANSYTTQFFQRAIEEQNVDKEAKFKTRLAEFKNISTRAEAKELAQKIMPVNSERTVFRVGNSKCIIINREQVFRITYIGEKEFISYNFQ